MKEEILRVENLSVKAANRQKLEVSYLNMFRGESLTLMGLNDSGIGLMIDVLCGKLPPQKGKVLIAEKRVRLLDEASARFAGVYRISQEQTLIDELSIAENIFVLRRRSLRNVLINRRMLLSQAKILLGNLGLTVSPATRVGRLSPTEKHLVELAKAVGSGAKIVIFDEAFSQYNPDDLQNLKQIIDKLKQQGISFIFRCNYTEEVQLFSDRINFFRDGRIIKKIDAAAFDNSMIADYVVGYSLEKYSRSELQEEGRVAFEIEKIVLPERQKSIPFSIKHGEVVSLLDMDAREKDRLVEIFCGKVKNPGSPVKLNGNVLLKTSTDFYLQQKIVVIPDLGQTNVLLDNLSIEENLLFPSLRKVVGPAGTVRPGLLKMLKKQISGSLNRKNKSIRDLDSNEKITILLERWLIYRPEVLILVDPFLKSDEVGSSIITDYINKFTKVGTAVIIITSRTHKLKEVSDRVIYLKPDKKNKTAAEPASQATGLPEFLQKGLLHFLIESGKKYSAALLMIIGYFLVEYTTLSTGDVKLLLRQFAILGFAALGAYLTVLCDGYNFSTGSQAAFTSVLAAFLFASLGLPVWLVILISFLASMLLGAFYAVVTIRTNIPILLFSLGMLYILNGVSSGIQNTNWVVQIKHLNFLAFGEIASIPFPLILFTLAAVLIHLILHYTYLGKSILAVGSNKKETRRSGLPVNTVKIAAYLISFALINFTGLFFLGRTSTGNAAFGNSYYYDILVALSLGRISLWGGRGNVFGVTLGTLSMILLESFVILSGIGLYYQFIIKGLLILFMIYLDYRSARRENRSLGSLLES